jgi:hypothetical protein
MRMPHRFSVCVALLSALAAAGFWGWRGSRSTAELNRRVSWEMDPYRSDDTELAGVLGLDETIEEHRQRARELDVGYRAVERSRRAKCQAANELVAGRLTLWEAAARFREVTVRPRECVVLLRSFRHGASDDELFCRCVIEYVESELAADPARAAAVVGRLNVELAERRRHGPIRLDKPASHRTEPLAQEALERNERE